MRCAAPEAHRIKYARVPLGSSCRMFTKQRELRHYITFSNCAEWDMWLASFKQLGGIVPYLTDLAHLFHQPT